MLTVIQFLEKRIQKKGRASSTSIVTVIDVSITAWFTLDLALNVSKLFHRYIVQSFHKI